MKKYRVHQNTALKNISKCSQTITLQGTLTAISRSSSIPPVTSSRNYWLQRSTDQAPGVVIHVHTTKACVRTGGLSPRTLTTTLDGREMVGWVGQTAVLDVSGKRICPHKESNANSVVVQLVA